MFWQKERWPEHLQKKQLSKGTGVHYFVPEPKLRVEQTLWNRLPEDMETVTGNSVGFILSNLMSEQSFQTEKSTCRKIKYAPPTDGL
jgi:hypothetical protein